MLVAVVVCKGLVAVSPYKNLCFDLISFQCFELKEKLEGFVGASLLLLTEVWRE